MGEAQSIDEVTVVGSYAELEYGPVQSDWVGPRISDWIDMLGDNETQPNHRYAKLLIDYEKLDIVHTAWIKNLGIKVAN